MQQLKREIMEKIASVEDVEALEQEIEDYLLSIAIDEMVAEDDYEELLNDCYPDVNVCGYEYEAGHILREVDPTAFRCGFLDYVDEDYYIMEYNNDWFYVSRDRVQDFIDDCE